MTRDELVDQLAARIGAPRHSAQAFLHACFDVVKSELRAGERVTLPGLGSWSPQRDPDNRLVGVRYAAGTPQASGAADMDSADGATADGAAFDAMHFIPAAALERALPPRPAGVDVAELVDDVRRAMGWIPEATAHTGTPLDVDALSDAEYADAADALIDEEAADVAEDMPESGAWNVADAPDEMEGMLETGTEIEADDLLVTDARNAENVQSAADIVSDADDLLEVEMQVEHYELQATQDVEADAARAAEEDGEDPLSDSEVFHRNRDQLYHPPNEPSRRTLVVTAVVLTVCMLAIVLYLLLDTGAQPDIPGTPAIGAVMAPGGAGARLNT